MQGSAVSAEIQLHLRVRSTTDFTMRTSVHGAWAALNALLAAALLLPGVTHAQGRRPPQSFQNMGGLHGLDGMRPDASLLRQNNGQDNERIPDVAALRQARGKQAHELIRLHEDVIEADPHGDPILKRQILVVSPSKEDLAKFLASGFTVAGTHTLRDLDLQLTTLVVPAASFTGDALLRLREISPNVIMDFDHLYTMSEAEDAPGRASTPVASRTGAGNVRLGLIDGGVDASHAVFRKAKIVHWGCQEKRIPSEHGTAVGSLMVGEADQFKGVAPGGTLFAADVYCGLSTGGSASEIALALAWLAKNEVPVINISLVGPSNRILEQAVLAMIRRGHVLTAAVGNDGPAAPPLYPASYPGVIGVSAVDDRRRVLPEAARGPQVAFIAPGSKMLAASPGAPDFRVVRGTSFAAPIVAALLAERISKPGAERAASAVQDLAKQAIGGNGSRSSDKGWGLVGEAYRISPDQMQP
ncbi:hypothetical protein GCM10027321_24260 [Massilia terrae]|uniref:S8 family serine peptidase n=1 Tax=Massilia terrae TaxID=1811224 RepID=A0ABT2CWU3_9BURK|nr:S8 family serine peptidase [Massilia terrae]MCS0658434.1 S8 family serine peptidase [Massilia terrae]